MLPYRSDNVDTDLPFDEEDDAKAMQNSVVVNRYFEWGQDRQISIPLNEPVIHELHVKGFGRCHLQLPEASRGTYASLGAKLSAPYLNRLGVINVELMPVHACLTHRHSAEKEVSNYSGYNTSNFFSPDARYSGSSNRDGQVLGADARRRYHARCRWLRRSCSGRCCPGDVELPSQAHPVLRSQAVPGGKWQIIIDTNDSELVAATRYCELGILVDLVPLSTAVAREAEPPGVTALLSEERQ